MSSLNRLYVKPSREGSYCLHRDKNELTRRHREHEDGFLRNRMRQEASLRIARWRFIERRVPGCWTQCTKRFLHAIWRPGVCARHVPIPIASRAPFLPCPLCLYVSFPNRRVIRRFGAHILRCVLGAGSCTIQPHAERRIHNRFTKSGAVLGCVRAGAGGAPGPFLDHARQ